MAYYFNLPQINDLTLDQQTALDEVGAIALSGGPGTGKSVVCLWRQIRNHATGSKKSLLLTYTKTLQFYLQQCAAKYSPNAKVHIERTQQWTTSLANTSYDEIIIDEGQDVAADKYEQIKRLTPKVCFSADDAQSLYQHGCDSASLNALFPNNESYRLHKNFRNSREILTFIRHVFPDIFIPQAAYEQARVTHTKPILKVCGTSKADQITYILAVIKEYAGDTHNIAVLVPRRKDVNRYYASLNPDLAEHGIHCSKYESDDSGVDQLNGVHITTFKSSKGTEFDTVIIPEFDEMSQTIYDLDLISEKDYYVGFTRAKTNLFLTCMRRPGIELSNSVEIEN